MTSFLGEGYVRVWGLDARHWRVLVQGPGIVHFNRLEGSFVSSTVFDPLAALQRKLRNAIIRSHLAEVYPGEVQPGEEDGRDLVISGKLLLLV